MKKELEEGAVNNPTFGSLNLPTINITSFLVILLIVGAFLLGSLTTKVQYLENGGSIAGAKQATGQTDNQAAVPQAQPAAENIDPVDDGEHIKGNKNAKIALVEYSDLECPFCQRHHPTMSQLLDEYGDKIKWVYRHYPLSFHANAAKEDEASECVAQLGGNDKFWEYIDKIFERTTSNGTGFALDELAPLASEIGINQSQFQECLDSGRHKNHATENLSKYQFGTPTTFLVNDKGESKKIEGAVPIDTFKAAIDSML